MRSITMTAGENVMTLADLGLGTSGLFFGIGADDAL
jgi:hypothetical protein